MSRRLVIPPAAGAVLLTLAAGLLAGAAPAGPVSFRSGVYTQAQADRGLKTFTHNCAACHGDLFDGSESGPRLSDDPFLDKWKDKTLGDLFNKMQTSMPPLPDQPGRLSSQEYVDIIAAMLAINEIPAGKSELPATKEALGQISMK
jgi:mono/diheme cytochrome c family protein